MEFLPQNWHAMFALETPILELVIRGVLLYLAILLLLRILPRRTTGELGPMDLVLILLITESASHALGNYKSLSDGVVQIAVVGLSAYLINALSHRYRGFKKLIEAPPLKIIENGKLIKRNLRREFITQDELDSQLRANNIKDASEVRCAYVEGEGNITFVKNETGGNRPSSKLRTKR